MSDGITIPACGSTIAWPGLGSTISLPDAVYKHLVRSGHLPEMREQGKARVYWCAQCLLVWVPGKDYQDWHPVSLSPAYPKE